MKVLKNDYNCTNMGEDVEIYTNRVTFSGYHLQQTLFPKIVRELIVKKLLKD